MEIVNFSATVRSDVRQMGDTLCIFQNILPIGHLFWDALIPSVSSGRAFWGHTYVKETIQKFALISFSGTCSGHHFVSKTKVK